MNKKIFNSAAIITMLVSLMLCVPPVAAVSIAQLNAHPQFNGFTPGSSTSLTFTTPTLQSLINYNAQYGFVRNHTPLDPALVPSNPNPRSSPQPSWDDLFTWEQLFGSPAGCGCGCNNPYPK